MKNWLLVLFCVVAYSSQTKANEEITFQTHTIESDKAELPLKFTVALPWGYDEKKAYPVLYTTAGGSRFKSFVHQIDWLSHVGMGPLPQFIIVNIPQVTVPSDMHPKFITASGIANELQLSVLKAEVLPYIEKKFITQDFKLLEGYSSNGNFVLHTYITNNTLFDGYLAYSPALELDESGIVKKLTTTVLSDTSTHSPLYLSLGPFVGNKSLYESIKANLFSHSNTKFEDFSKHNFLSVATLSVNNSIEWFFSDLSPKTATFADEGIAAIKTYYSELERKYKKPMDYSNTAINLSFYYANQGEKAKALETINVVVNSNPDNIYYLTRKALILYKIGHIDQSQQSYLRAKELAIKTNDDDAISFINGELSKFQSE